MDRLRIVRGNHQGKVAVVYRHYPLTGHPYAMLAARASECAAAQHRFEPFEGVLFASQSAIGHIPWVRFASAAGVADTAAFRKCAASDSTLIVVEHDRAAARQLGVSGTPVLLINQIRLEGAQPLDTLEAYVARILTSTK